MIHRQILGELLGTFVMVLFGCGSVAVAVLFQAHAGVLSVALTWGIAVMLAIYLSRHLSGAHLNPAVTLAMILSGRMPAGKFIVYSLSQLTGAVLAGLTVYMLFAPTITAFEKTNGITRGTPESVQTAMIFGEFYPNPTATGAVVSMPLAIAAEAFGTFLLVLLIFMSGNKKNSGAPSDGMLPVFIGVTVTSIICLIAPLTQAGINPARDLGPRLVCWLAGWGHAAFCDRSGGFLFVYILGPFIGATAATYLFKFLIEPSQDIERSSSCK